MGIPIGGGTGHLLWMGVDGAVSLYGNEKQPVPLVPISVKNFFRDAFRSALAMQYGCS
jgi:hypothetical protein